MAAKIFEVGDVLPATTQLRIGWVGDITNFLGDKYIYSDNGHFELVSRFEDSDNIYIARSSGAGVLIYYGETHIFVHPYTNYNGDHPYCDIDTSTWDINSRTVSSVSPGMDVFTWEDLAPAPSGYTITFNSNGGTTISDIEEATELPTPLLTPTKDNHTFLGWYYDSDFTNEAFADDPLTGNVTLYAKWELTTYTITYNSNGGSNIPQTSDATQLPSPLPTPTKRGYKFVAWYYESNFQTRAKAGDTIEANTTLYAKWHNLRTLFTGIANAIRSKDGTSGNIRDLDFDDRIMAIAEGKPIEVSTAAAMDNLLVSGNVGKIYKFTGPTDANYINGELYEVVSD